MATYAAAFIKNENNSYYAIFEQAEEPSDKRTQHNPLPKPHWVSYDIEIFKSSDPTTKIYGQLIQDILSSQTRNKFDFKYKDEKEDEGDLTTIMPKDLTILISGIGPVDWITRFYVKFAEALRIDLTIRCVEHVNNPIYDLAKVAPVFDYRYV